MSRFSACGTRFTAFGDEMTCVLVVGHIGDHEGYVKTVNEVALIELMRLRQEKRQQQAQQMREATVDATRERPTR